jgi:hypothetical protein
MTSAFYSERFTAARDMRGKKLVAEMSKPSWSRNGGNS